jgi:CDP-diglyceride synthetase
MSKTVLGILIGILIFVAAGILATYWVGKMRRDMEDKKPRVVWRLPQQGFAVS